jgi:hypothetical protein
MDQGGGLQGVPRRLPRHPVRRQPTELVINERQQLLGRLLVIFRNLSGSGPEIAHSRNVIW